jgi:hypothetical protein
MPVFNFKGGVRRPDTHASEKFLLFMLMGDGTEIPFWTAYENGLIQKVEGEQYQTTLKLIKIYAFESIFGKGRRWHSFWLKLEKGGETVTIRPFALKKSPYYFEGAAKLLTGKEIAPYLSNGSKKFAEKQTPLPRIILEEMVKLKQAKPSIRAIHIQDEKRRKPRKGV